MFDFILGILQLILIYYVWTKVSRDKKNKIFHIIYIMCIFFFFIVSYKNYEMSKLNNYQKDSISNKNKIPCDTFYLIKDECKDFNRFKEIK